MGMMLCSSGRSESSAVGYSPSANACADISVLSYPVEVTCSRARCTRHAGGKRGPVGSHSGPRDAGGGRGGLTLVLHSEPPAKPWVRSISPLSTGRDQPPLRRRSTRRMPFENGGGRAFSAHPIGCSTRPESPGLEHAARAARSMQHERVAGFTLRRTRPHRRRPILHALPSSRRTPKRVLRDHTLPSLNSAQPFLLPPPHALLGHVPSSSFPPETI